MSAWLTSPGHNQYVAEILQKYDERYTKYRLENLTSLLTYFNRLSIATRYSYLQEEEKDPTNRVETIPELITIDPSWLEQNTMLEQSQALACYRYQTCESELYNDSILARNITKYASRLETIGTPRANSEPRWGIKTEELILPYKARELV